jgi:hypothetical protein
MLQQQYDAVLLPKLWRLHTLQDRLSLGDRYQMPLPQDCPSLPLALQSKQYDNLMACSIQMKLLGVTNQQSSTVEQTNTQHQSPGNATATHVSPKHQW